MNDNENEFMTIGETAKYLRVSKNTVRLWSNSGQIKAFRVGSRQDRRYVRGDVIAFAKGESLEIGDSVTTVDNHKGIINSISPGALYPYSIIDKDRVQVGIYAEAELTKQG